MSKICEWPKSGRRRSVPKPAARPANPFARRKVESFPLADCRTPYQTYRSDPDLQRLHERHAMIAIWDDHEFAMDS
ncbi:alkaline phosphatase D family protein [Polycladomyces sp. WAk]|uniref:Alkaline phosphatase D family protein n=1 Tax=Polycladomyces zharkentensis TaxID=2807616 RepID=A0ABS2WGI8_9BACL|nr:alkaline phosphatase D family protein [Polycladomyces sp. WAk]